MKKPQDFLIRNKSSDLNKTVLGQSRYIWMEIFLILVFKIVILCDIFSLKNSLLKHVFLL